MNRTGLMIALAIAAITGLAFGLYPQLDLTISAPFHAMTLGGYSFGWHIYPPLMLARDIGLWVGALLVVPAVAALVILIAIAESFKIRSLLVHALAGAAMLLLGYYSSGLSNRYEESIDRPPPPISREIEIAAAAGVMFGLVYWAIAGRKAGRWRAS